MQDRPQIKTALPKQRYQIGDHTATLLGEIETDDERRYHFILALVPMGEQEPVLYVTSEQAPAERRSEGAYDLRVISASLTDVLDTADRWQRLDQFAEQALDLAQQVLGLRNQQVVKLM
ncbi:hypothetical protein [Halochromatium salexigens]|uniref:Uncharacterized protein n=1 Tax=Halochromatium salexigens TaxID=49447 RepID=A0AAJ0UER9_HALSE|nr:hypothetical protein [Halochromatium salexigens]MBK5930109.1 hypothetical protein [Halochromatium salexigens]